MRCHCYVKGQLARFTDLKTLNKDKKPLFLIYIFIFNLRFLSTVNVTCKQRFLVKAEPSVNQSLTTEKYLRTRANFLKNSCNPLNLQHSFYGIINLVSSVDSYVRFLVQTQFRPWEVSIDLC